MSRTLAGGCCDQDWRLCKLGIATRASRWRSLHRGEIQSGNWTGARHFRSNGPIYKMNRSAPSIHKTHWTPLPSEARIYPCRNPNQNRFICAASMPRAICCGFMRYPRSPPCSEKCR